MMSRKAASLWDWALGLAEGSPFDPGLYNADDSETRLRAASMSVVTVREAGDAEEPDAAHEAWLARQLRRDGTLVGKSRMAGDRTTLERIGHHNMRSHQRGAIGSLTVAQWREVQRRFGGLCAYCGFNPGTQIEHVIPVSGGGSTTVGNVVPACWACNRDKGTSEPLAWLERRGFADAFMARCLAASEAA